jgi:hypothetical protein
VRARCFSDDPTVVPWRNTPTVYSPRDAKTLHSQQDARRVNSHNVAVLDSPDSLHR